MRTIAVPYGYTYQAGDRVRHVDPARTGVLGTVTAGRSGLVQQLMGSLLLVRVCWDGDPSVRWDDARQLTVEHAAVLA